MEQSEGKYNELDWAKASPKIKEILNCIADLCETEAVAFGKIANNQWISTVQTTQKSIPSVRFLSPLPTNTAVFNWPSDGFTSPYDFKNLVYLPIILTKNLWGAILMDASEHVARQRHQTVKLLIDLLIFYLAKHSKQASFEEDSISRIVHDLRNPIGATLNAAQVFGKIADTEKLQKLARIISDASQRTLQLVENLGDFAHCQFGTGLKHEKHPIADINQLITPLLAIHQKNKINSHTQVLFGFYGDAKRLAQLFAILIENACMHSPQEQAITINTKLNNQQFVFSVTNHTVPSFTPNIDAFFVPFTPTVPSVGKKGLGLGLYLAQKIAHLHGGELSVIAKNNKVTVSVTLPNHP